MYLNFHAKIDFNKKNCPLKVEEKKNLLTNLRAKIQTCIWDIGDFLPLKIVDFGAKCKSTFL